MLIHVSKMGARGQQEPQAIFSMVTVHGTKLPRAILSIGYAQFR